MVTFKSTADAIDALLEKVGKVLRVATPLGAGKPNLLLNELYRRAKQDPSLDLVIMTALTLTKPSGKSDLEKRFLGPFVDRVFKDYPDLDYELDRLAGKLPANVKIVEFYFPAGKYIGCQSAQQNYISSNYTHVTRDLQSRGVNVLLQQVAVDPNSTPWTFSLSCNADVTGDLLPEIRAKADRGEPAAIVFQVNSQLPFMTGHCLVEESQVDFLVNNEGGHYHLFSPPNEAISDVDYMIGLNASTLIRDGGELQIGIGALGDAITYALLRRQQDNRIYREVLDQLDFSKKFPWTEQVGRDLNPFRAGLFAATEMLVPGFLHLLDAGILKRRVYDDVILQRLLNERKITEDVSAQTLEHLLRARAIDEVIGKREFTYLQYWGVFRADLSFESGVLVTSDGQRIEAHLGKLDSREAIFNRCLGNRLKNGRMVHAGFFLGPQDFYQRLRQLPMEIRDQIDMRSVTKINQLYGHEEIDRLHRRYARFVNTCMMITMDGSAVSDALEDGTVISGIGGQYNFVAMAHALPEGRSILNVRSTRGEGSSLRSNLVWNYGHNSIPRQLRDIVVTEYGVADLRGKTDAEIIDSLLRISDSRFQSSLLEQARKMDKISADYRIPEAYRHNLPESLNSAMGKYRSHGFFPRYPFGCDFSDVELELIEALKSLKRATQDWTEMTKRIVQSAARSSSSHRFEEHLQRMGLSHATGIKERLTRRLLLQALYSATTGRQPN
ncbi:MAG: acetyl-CoA hydrolase/transferase C-terminal domain-containing protein [Bdellovibrionales bacterium]